jgi:malate dehydrogenase (oxaloacetate-decarboxylating)(NADP+)
LIPRAFDPRLITQIAPAVAKAAMDSGVATLPISDLAAYRNRLTQFVYQSASAMRPVFAAAKRNPKRVVFAEGEEPRVLQAAQVAVDERLARPVLVGRTDLIEARIEKLGLRLKRQLRWRQHQQRQPLPRCLERLLRTRQARWRDPRPGHGRNAQPSDLDRCGTVATR